MLRDINIRKTNLSSSDDVLVTPIERSSTNRAHKTSQMVDGKSRPHHQVMRHQTLPTPAAFDPKPSFIVTTAQ